MTFIDFLMLKYSYILGIKLIWVWKIIFFYKQQNYLLITYCAVHLKIIQIKVE